MRKYAVIIGLLVLILSGCSNNLELYKQNVELEKRVNSLQDSLSYYSKILREFETNSGGTSSYSTIRLQNSYLVLDERISNLEDMVIFHGDRIESMFDMVTESTIKVEELENIALKGNTKGNQSEAKVNKPSQAQKKIDNLNKKKIPADTQYSQARVLYVNNNYSAARDKFSQIIKYYPNNELVPNCYYWIAEIDYDLKDYQSSYDNFEHIVDNWPDTEKASDSMLKMAIIHRTQGDHDSALDLAMKLKRLYPNYVRIDRVNRMIEELK